MYYKIENKECEVYQKLHEMRTEELRFEEENKAAIKEKTGLDWDSYLGNFGQQNWNRVTHYNGFKFKDTENIDLSIWKRHLKYKGVYVPNTRTKKGREILELLNNGLKGHLFNLPFDILGIKHSSKFSFPVVEICADTILIYLGEDYNIESDDIIEITTKEFNHIRESAHQ
ncbi:hypothetical protein OU798_07610 [Prolixibacteraceae bacterium Z1-6]|uniref:Uncharacterized protein n=1 Tax=Draconibacterium aestuarii TaxID=2998507 RepID=A0A9X3F454_9BACT|nr:hypothetical protein [Prolixibacteraceae bacterium Z1-6]